MGLSSNARLLTLTTRIKSNEYQSQRIANSKMRLATESQEASAEYIKALNTQKMVYNTYDASNEVTNETLTTNLLYKYGEMKNQYILSNVHSQALVTKEDADNFEKSATLDEFLKANGIEKLYKTEELRDAYEKISSPEYIGYKKAYDEAYDEAMNSKYHSGSGLFISFFSDINGSHMPEQHQDYMHNIDNEVAKALGYDDRHSLSDTLNQMWQKGMTPEEIYHTYKDIAKVGVSIWKEKYTEALDDPIDNDELEIYNATCFENIKNTYRNLLKLQEQTASIDTIIDGKISGYYDGYIGEWHPEIDGTTEDTYKNMQKYKEAVAAFDVVKEKYGENPTDWFSYDDPTKAQWYTNLWYRLNGESTLKSKDGLAQANYQVLDGRLLDSESWIRDSLAQGIITVEQAKYDPNAPVDVPDKNSPTMFDLKGITWTSKMLSNCVDLKQVDDNVAITKAEAQYQQKTQEISAKDQKLTNKIRKLDSEHSSLEKAYEQAKQALQSDIDRSFGTFS